MFVHFYTRSQRTKKKKKENKKKKKWHLKQRGFIFQYNNILTSVNY